MVTRRHELDEVHVPAGPLAQRRARVYRRRARRRVLGTAALYAAVALGTMIGGVLRAIASLTIQSQAGPGFSWGTLFVNATGSFLIGCYATLTGPEGRLFAGATQRQFVMTGICGGYTTFSVFSLEIFRLLRVGEVQAAAISVGVSVVTWLAAVWAGHAVASRNNRLRRP